MLSAFMRSFINDAELCCEQIGQQAALLWVGANPEPTPAPARAGAFCRAIGSLTRLSPHRLASGKDRGSYGAGYVYACEQNKNYPMPQVGGKHNM